MKALLILMAMTLSTHASADSTGSDASWVVETGTMLISGEAAQDLYESLNSKIKMDPQSTSWDEVRIKRNKFATCRANFGKITLEDGDTSWDHLSTECQIHAPKGTTIKE